MIDRRATLDEIRAAWDSLGEHPSARKVEALLAEQGLGATYTQVARLAKAGNWPHRSPPPAHKPKPPLVKPKRVAAAAAAKPKQADKDTVEALAEELIVDMAYLQKVRAMGAERLQAEMLKQARVATTVLAASIQVIAAAAPSVLMEKPTAIGKLLGDVVDTAAKLVDAPALEPPAGDTASPPAASPAVVSSVAAFEAFARARTNGARPNGNGHA